MNTVYFNRTVLRFAFLLFASGCCSVTGFSQDAKDIIRRMDEKMRGNSSVAEMKITIVRPSWSREMVMKSWSKGTDFGMIFILSPAREKGMAFLKRGKEVWNWVPSIERNIKLPPSMMMQSWMGTDFTNDDLVKQSSIIEDYNHRIAGDSIIDGKKCWAIELIPRPQAPVVWGKINVWVDKTDYIEMLARFYDEDGMLINTMRAGDIKMLGGRMLPSRLELEPNGKQGQKTIMEYISLSFDIPVEDKFFTPDNMRKLK